MGGWNLPDNVSDNDPDAPWNQTDGHCTCCPAHEDNADDFVPECTECEGREGSGTCYLYLTNFHHYFNWSHELNDFERQWWRPVLRTIDPRNLLWRISGRLSGLKFLRGLNDSACNFREEPNCECDDCDCGPDYDDRDDD